MYIIIIFIFLIVFPQVQLSLPIQLGTGRSIGVERILIENGLILKTGSGEWPVSDQPVNRQPGPVFKTVQIIVQPEGKKPIKDLSLVGLPLCADRVSTKTWTMYSSSWSHISINVTLLIGEIRTAMMPPASTRVNKPFLLFQIAIHILIVSNLPLMN